MGQVTTSAFILTGIGCLLFPVMMLAAILKVEQNLLFPMVFSSTLPMLLGATILLMRLDEIDESLL